MTNTILRRKIVQMIALCYAMDQNSIVEYHEKLGSYDMLIQALENNTLDQVLHEKQ